MININIKSIDETITIDGNNYLLLPKQDLIAILNDKEETKKERVVIKNTVIKFLNLLGFIDEKTGKLKEDLGKSKFSFIASLTGKLPKLFEMFSNENGEGKKLLQDLKPLINKYANE